MSELQTEIEYQKNIFEEKMKNIFGTWLISNGLFWDNNSYSVFRKNANQPNSFDDDVLRIRLSN